jgi:hypothetical protein
VIYGWGDQPTHRSEFGDVRINLVGNYYINGPAKKSDYIFREAYPARTFLFERGNFHDADQDSTHNGKPVGLAADFKSTFRDFDDQDQILTPPDATPFNFFATVEGNVLPAEAAYARVISKAGASLWRDAIDTRITQAVVHRTGSLIDSQDSLRGLDGKLPGIDDLQSNQRPTNFDTDGDGMSDAFEREHGLNPNDAADGNSTNLSKEGYTNLEVYINSLIAKDKQP